MEHAIFRVYSSRNLETDSIFSLNLPGPVITVHARRLNDPLYAKCFEIIYIQPNESWTKFRITFGVKECMQWTLSQPWRWRKNTLCGFLLWIFLTPLPFSLCVIWCWISSSLRLIRTLKMPTTKKRHDSLHSTNKRAANEQWSMRGCFSTYRSCYWCLCVTSMSNCYWLT